MLPQLLYNVFMAVTTGLAVDAIRHSAAPIQEPSNKEGNAKMSYDLIGTDDLFDDDDDVGAIGSDDEELLEELVSGLGDSEIVGEDDDDDLIVGARRRRSRGRARSAAKKIASRRAAAVVRSGLNKRRRYPLGFIPTSIATGITTSVPASPQNLYRAERLVIPSDIAFDLGITDIKVGNQSQFVQNVEVPAAIFSEVAIDTAVHFDTAEVGNQVSVAARNKSATTVQFTAALIGTAAK